MKLLQMITRNAGPFALSAAIVAAAVALPKLAAAGELKEEMRCNIKKTSCIIITDRDLDIPHVSIFTHEICPDAKPYVVKIELNNHVTWHSRYTCNGVLRQTIFSKVSYIKQ